MQLLTKELGRLVELYVVSHTSENPVKMDNCKVYFIPEIRNFMEIKRRWRILLTQLQPDVVHVNCCWMPACAFTQKWAQALGYKVVLTPHGMLEPWIMARHHWTRKLSKGGSDEGGCIARYCRKREGEFTEVGL